MGRIVFVRHSQTRIEPRVSSHEWTLTEEGQRRCERLAHELAPLGITRIVTSEEHKAELTGQLVAKVLQVPMSSAVGLGETRRETLPFFSDVAEFRSLIRRGFEAPDELVVGEERFSDALARFSSCVDDLLDDDPRDVPAVVTHGTVLCLYLSSLTGTPAYALWEPMGQPAYVVVDLATHTIEHRSNVE
ncbi:MAG: histidine phosphatase family protein [Planctomycetota bacterium]|nr:histidine phosphatase family protein [Planctomycetota bacterium]